MTTKYDVTDVVVVKGVITRIEVDISGKTMYRVKITDKDGGFGGFISVNEKAVYYIEEEKEQCLNK